MGVTSLFGCFMIHLTASAMPTFTLPWMLCFSPPRMRKWGSRRGSTERLHFQDNMIERVIGAENVHLGWSSQSMFHLPLSLHCLPPEDFPRSYATSTLLFHSRTRSPSTSTFAYVSPAVHLNMHQPPPPWPARTTVPDCPPVAPHHRSALKPYHRLLDSAYAILVTLDSFVK